MSIFGRKSELDGAWEEPGVIGSRIEIEGKKLTLLWRNTPVLETTFKIRPDKDGGMELELASRGLRYPQSNSDYAQLTGLYYIDGKLTMTEFFPISGESKTVMSKTNNSRYGNYEIADKEAFPMLEGVWKAENWDYEFKIGGGKIEFNGEKIAFHALKSLSGGFGGVYRLVDDDPSKYELFWFANAAFDGSVITAMIPVCDAPSVNLTFKKVK